MADRIILGIDPGTTITGYGLIRCKGKKIELITYGVIQLGRAQISHPEKLKKIFERISSLIEEFKPTEMALEAPFHGKNVQSMLKLGRAQGVAMAAGIVNGLTIAEYAPKKVKVAVTGNGGASKHQVAGMLEKLLSFKLEDIPMDATDGLAVAVCHFFQANALGSGKGYSGWGAFLKDNPHRKKGR